MQLTRHWTRRATHGASRLVHAMFTWSVKTRRAPSRYSRNVRVYDHTTTSIHKLSTPPPPYSQSPRFHKSPSFHLRHISAMARTGSTAQELVEPTLALTNTGVRPAAMSSFIAAARSAASKASALLKSGPSPLLVGISFMFPPSPAMLAAFWTDECAWRLLRVVRTLYAGSDKVAGDGSR